jgi:hypothetical protein
MDYPYFTVYLTNMRFELEREFPTLEAAKAGGDDTGFEYAVMKVYGPADATLVGYKNHFGGWHDVPEKVESA